MLVIIDQVDKHIPAIKAVRSVTGWGLREAKNVIDDVLHTNRAAVIPAHGDHDVVMGLLHEFNDAMEWRVTNVDEESHLTPRPTDERIIMDALERMPGHLYIQDVLGVLNAI